MKRKQKVLIVIPRYSVANNIIVKNLIFDTYFMNTLRSWHALRCLILFTAEGAKDAKISSKHSVFNYNYSYSFPLGLSYISAVLKSAGYHVDCLNLNHCEGYIENIIDKSLSSKQKYDYVCTGNVSLGYAITEKIINTVSAHESRPKIVLGGIIITSVPEIIFKSLNPDFAVIGEGEKTILELLEYLERGGNLEEVKGIGYLDKDGNIIFTKRREPIKDLDVLPMLDFEAFGFEEQLDHQHSNYYYFNNVFDYPRTYPLLGSRDCEIFSKVRYRN